MISFRKSELRSRVARSHAVHCTRMHTVIDNTRIATGIRTKGGTHRHHGKHRCWNTVRVTVIHDGAAQRRREHSQQGNDYKCEPHPDDSKCLQTVTTTRFST